MVFPSREGNGFSMKDKTRRSFSSEFLGVLGGAKWRTVERVLSLSLKSLFSFWAKFGWTRKRRRSLSLSLDRAVRPLAFAWRDITWEEDGRRKTRACFLSFFDGEMRTLPSTLGKRGKNENTVVPTVLTPWWNNHRSL